MEKAARPIRTLRPMIALRKKTRCRDRAPDQAIGMIGVAALTAMAAKNTAPTNERAMRWAVSKRNDMGISFDWRGVGPSGPRYRMLCTARASFLTR